MGEKTFEVGLVMAGAVSAGAYTAGVIDFLLQALQEWDDAKKAGRDDVPPHDVIIKVIAGASAGGMTGAILAAMINEAFTTIDCLPGREPTPEEITRNKLYNAWVEQVDIHALLQNNDLRDSTNKVRSLLDSTVLDEIADGAIQFKARGSRPAYIAEQLHLYLTVTNLEGVPYDIAFKGSSGKSHSISRHTDYFHFLLGNRQPESPETEWLNPDDDDHPNWHLLKNVALATGAFPGGLAPRVLDRSFSHYDLRSWPIPQRPDPEATLGDFNCVKMQEIKPSWPQHEQQKFNFLSVDGGVMDNEPMELARLALAGDQQYNPRGASRVQRSVIMVDPFPSKPKAALKQNGELNDHDILSVFQQLFGSLLSQSRFKPDELILANSDDVHSRYLIAPTRNLGDNTKAEHPIASGFFNGFGGFMSKKFRMHDFQLGRRNCQQFLRRYFSLPLEQARLNPVFSAYSDDDFDRFSFGHNGTSYLPIIPLVSEASSEVFPLRWSTLKMSDAELDAIRDGVNNRTKVVISRLIDQYVGGRTARWGARTVARFKRGDIVDKIMKTVENDLREFDLKS